MRFHFIKYLILCALFAAPLSAFAEMNSLLKWLLFSDKAYASQIEVKTYILSEQQAAEFLTHPEKEPEQLNFDELQKFMNCYLVVSTKNLGGRHCWGILACSLPGVWNPIKIQMINIGDTYGNYLIFLDGISLGFGKETPQVTFEWDSLYTK